MSLFHSYKLKRRKVDPKDAANQAKAIHLHLAPPADLLAARDRREPPADRRPKLEDNSSSSGSCDECLDLSTRARPLLMGDIPGQGDGHKTMVWAAAPPAPNGAPPVVSSVSSVVSSQTSQVASSMASSEKTSASNSPSSTSTPPQPDSSLALAHLTSVVGVGVVAEPSGQLSGRELVLQQMASSEDQNQQMICMICEDRATGLHYGIITCEGCKGFFKRTVQNKRVYTCVADGTCVITKQQRNRCQYCRFQKCLRQGMVLAAVREDRMPGGRNSGAVYNLYKVKYRKHKKPGQQGGPPPQNPQTNGASQILKSALTCPRDAQQPYVQAGGHVPRVGHNPYVLGNHAQQNQLATSQAGPGAPALAVVTTTSSVPPITSASSPIMRQMNALMTREPVMTREESDQLLAALIECDDFHDFSSLSSLDSTDASAASTTSQELSDRLCSIGDSIVYRLVQWTKRLPFYDQLPVHVHTQLLTHKWHELLVLSTCAFTAIEDESRGAKEEPEAESLEAEVARAMANLAKNLARLNQLSPSTVISWQQLELEAGGLVQELCHVRHEFKLIALTLKEFVALKVVAMTTIPPNCDFFDTNVNHIRDKYLNALIAHLQAQGQHVQDDTCKTRMTSLLNCLQHVSNAAALLLQSKMFYVPFLMNRR